MYMHKEAKVAYLAHPRTASTATGKALFRQAGFENSHRHHDTPAECFEAHPDRYHKLSIEWTIFSTVRNHFEVFKSWLINTNYQGPDDTVLTVETLENLTQRERYFKNINPPPYRRLFYHVPFCTDIVRHETLQEDVNRILTTNGLDPVDIPKINVSRHTDEPYKDFIPQESREWIEDHYGIEMRRFNYTW